MRTSSHCLSRKVYFHALPRVLCTARLAHVCLVSFSSSARILCVFWDLNLLKCFVWCFSFFLCIFGVWRSSWLWIQHPVTAKSRLSFNRPTHLVTIPSTIREPWKTTIRSTLREQSKTQLNIWPSQKKD